MPRYYDLSQSITEDMSFFPGDPTPSIQPAQGVTLPWRVSELCLSSHTGTHIDAASHYLVAGMTIDQYPLERFILPGIVVHLGGLYADEAIGPDCFTGFLPELPKGGAILIRTDWDQYWGSELYMNHPYLSSEAASRLVETGASLVGIDALNVDSTIQATSRVHEILLSNNILIVENLARLSQLSAGEIYQFSFVPLSFPGLDGSPLRAIAWKE